MSNPQETPGDDQARVCEDRISDRRAHQNRERVTNVLAFAIVGSTIFTALWSFRYVGTAAEMEDAKALLAAMSGLSGVVIGYFFGRVPAEANASRAQDQMHAAVIEMQRMKGHMGTAAETVEGLNDKMASGKPVEVADIRRLREMVKVR